MAEVLSGVNGSIIKWAREFYNMSPEEAATAIGVDYEKYCNWEKGTDYPTYESSKKLVMYFINQVQYSSFQNHLLYHL